MLFLEHITKRFGPVLAINDVSLTIDRGELHALVGENGAGKSTLMRILSGVHRPDAGRVVIDGEEVTVFDPQHSRQRGTAMVHQELSLAPNLSVAENIFAAPKSRPARFGMLRWSEMRRRAAELIELFGAHIEPSATVAELPMGLRQVVEIAKALAAQPKVLILDEPTSSLEESETERFLDYLRKLKSSGLTILYTSHRMAEVFSLADRISVLRDGKLVATSRTAETTLERVIAQMVGRELLLDLRARAESSAGDVLLRVKGLTKRGQFEDVSLELRAGEILGLAGLVGAGRTESMQALVGFRSRDAGAVEVGGRPVQISSPFDALRAGIIYLPEDRKREGLFLEHSVAANIIAASLPSYAVKGFVSRPRATAAATRLSRDLDIRSRGIEAPAQSLSGGNQQKVLVAKALATGPRVLIVDEPTRGIDVAAKAEIHQILRRFAAEGGGVILISSDLPELLAISTRILVYYEGRIVADVPAAEATEEKVMHYAHG